MADLVNKQEGKSEVAHRHADAMDRSGHWCA